jgi:hypothetical protein
VKMLKKTFQAGGMAAWWIGSEFPGRSTLMVPNEMAVLLCVLSAFSVACGGRGQSAGDAKADEDAVRQQMTKYTQAFDAAIRGLHVRYG